MSNLKRFGKRNGRRRPVLGCHWCGNFGQWSCLL